MCVCVYTVRVYIIERPLNSAACTYYCGHVCGPLECACSTKVQILTLDTAYITHLSARRFSAGWALVRYVCYLIRYVCHLIRYECHLIRSYLLALRVQYTISNNDMRFQHKK